MFALAGEKMAPMADVLLVVDVQQELVEALPAQRRTEFLDTLTDLIEAARAAGTQVVYVRHNDEGLPMGTPAWEIAEDVGPQSDEPIVEKSHGDAFEETNLSEILASRQVGDLIVCGMQSDFCIDATARGAARRNYRVKVVEDAHATYARDGLSEAEICAQINQQLREAGVDIVPAAKVLAT